MRQSRTGFGSDEQLRHRQGYIFWPKESNPPPFSLVRILIPVFGDFYYNDSTLIVYSLREIPNPSTRIYYPGLFRSSFWKNEQQRRHKTGFWTDIVFQDMPFNGEVNLKFCLNDIIFPKENSKNVNVFKSLTYE